MKVSPILFSAPMVRALLDGRKTQTRRVLKEQEHELMPWRIAKTPGGPATYEWRSSFGRHVGYVAGLHCPGDVLWVREAWSGHYAFRATPPSQRVDVSTPDGPIFRNDVWFWADGNPEDGDYEKPRPGIHMPRWASRLTLVVTDVRVERVQECRFSDAVAEGLFTRWEPSTATMTNLSTGEAIGMRKGVFSYEEGGEEFEQSRDAFRALWNSINGPGAWQANPWVAAYTFTVHVQNVDTFLAEGEAA